MAKVTRFVYELKVPVSYKFENYSKHNADYSLVSKLFVEFDDVTLGLLVSDPVPFGVVELGLLELGVLGCDADEHPPTEEWLQLPEVVHERKVQVGEETAEIVHL